jgi:tetratricopeptide (TPR) repeat protein
MPHRRTVHSAIHLQRLLEKAHKAHIEGDLEQAEKLYKTILERDPKNFDALHLLGFLNHQRGRSTIALPLLAAAIRHNAQSVAALSNYGLVLHALNRTVEALASYQAALAIEPNNADLLNVQGIALLNLGRPQEALMSLDRALAENPRHVEALGNRGNALVKLNHPDQAIACYDVALGIESDNIRLLTNRAHALRRLDRPSDALMDLRKAVALDPNYAEAQFELGMALLTLGHYEDGWKAYEQRWATRAFAHRRREFSSPLWTGEQPLHGATILLHGEQGLGDTIQFVRYATHVAQLGATVLLEVPLELVALMATVQGVTRIIANREKLTPFEFHCPLMSLPRAFRTSLASIPAEAPYIKVPEIPTAKWAARLPTGKPLVGVAWAGRSAQNNDANRSIALARFAPLFDAAGIQFVSLQRDPSADDLLLLRRHRNVLQLEDSLTDFVDTAALISRLDLVVSVDTSVAHLAGALAKPVCILLSFAADFRWLRARDDSPWYPTARLYRQPEFGDWESVIERVRGHLVGLNPTATVSAA